MVSCPNCGFGNADGVRFCNNCGGALESTRQIEGERRFATVLFADVARSTAIAERLDPEDWAQIINGAFGFMNAAVARYGGTVSRLMGDAVLALFGAPVAHEDDAERAVRAGLEIQESRMAYARAIKQKYGVDFELRVGINTGTAVLAFVGDATKTEYTALGDAANVAARLQSLAEPGTVLISADTEKLVHPLFDFRPRGKIEMKGKTEPVECFEVVGPKAMPGSTRGLEGLTSPLVGRDAEFSLLRQRLDDLERGVGSVVTVMGEAGLGKSRLIAELRHVRDGLPEPRPIWFEARAISYGQSIPYYPWRQLGRQLVGATETDTAPDLREKLRAFVERLGLAQKDLPFYETMLAIDTEQSRLALANLGGDAVVGGVANAVVNAVRAAIRQDGGMTPFILVMDDLHWSDSATLELLAQVAALAAFEPLLIVCLLRPDRKAPSWQLIDRLQGSLGGSYARLDLEPLNASASSQLLGNLLHIEDLPPSIRTQILERSEGNPFYLEEVLRSLIDDGQVVRENDHWRATRDIVDAKIPETLAGVLSARIDRLPEMTKRVAQTAAVIGRVFQHRVLESVCRAALGDEHIEHVEPHLAALSYEQLVRERARDPEREYIFKHALTCEAAYELLLKSRRRELHARTGNALETLFADRREEFAAMLAHHFSEADDLGRTVTYSRQAADSARRLFALREELEHRDRILVALGRMPAAPPSETIDAILDWVAVRHQLNRYEGVLDRLAEAVRTAREADDKRRLATALSWTATIHVVTGFPSRAFKYVTESHGLATSLGDEKLLLLPLFVATFAIVDRDPAEGARRLQQVIELARKHHVPEVESHAMAFRAVALARVGNFEAAHAQIDEALAIAPHAGSPVKQADVHIAVAMAFYDMGEIEEGLKHGRLGADMALAANGLECACSGYYAVGLGELQKRQFDAALGEFDRSLEYGLAANFQGYINAIRGGVARAEFEKGTPAAIDKLRSVVDNARAINDGYNAAVASHQLASALVRLNRREEALPYLAEALDYYRARGMRPYIAAALELAGDLREAAGEKDEAKRARLEAETLRQGLGVTLASTRSPIEPLGGSALRSTKLPS